jgi:glutamate-1-semialdehyde 2,1-aminomutase
MAVFGKALGNGYAITAVLGKKSIMEYAQDTFISSTFWTERIGSVAALKTLEVMKKNKSWEIITDIGLKYIGDWQDFYKITKWENQRWYMRPIKPTEKINENLLAS